MYVLSGAGGFIKSGSIYTIEHKGGRSCGSGKYANFRTAYLRLSPNEQPDSFSSIFLTVCIFHLQHLSGSGSLIAPALRAL